MTTTLSPRAPEHGSTTLPPRSQLVAGALVVGLCTDLALRTGGPSVAGALAVVVTAAALLRAGVVTNPTGRLLVLAAPVFGGWLAVRTSPWLVPFDALAALGLLAAGASLGRRGTLLDLPGGAVLVRAVRAVGHLFVAPTLLRRERPGAGTVTAAVLQGALLALPVVLLFGALLASADVVFASIVDVDLGAGDAVLHVVAVAAGGWAWLGLIRTADDDEPVEVRPHGVRLGTVQATVVLGAVAVLFGAFVASTVVGSMGGADAVLETAGLTQAEYARSGFFQLLWVVGLTVAALLALAAVADLEGPDGPRLRRLCAAVVVLALPIVAVALVRLDLYRDAYGWTMLRLVCTVVAVWLGLVLGLLGIALAGPSSLRRRGWLGPAAVAAALVLLFALNAADPEARVARHNLTRQASVAVDPAYLGLLSDDAVPTIVELLPTLDPATADAVAAAVGCEDAGGDGWAAWNRAAARAADARETLCRA